jgi:hypothetical protein
VGLLLVHAGSGVARAQPPELRHDIAATVTWLNFNGLGETGMGVGGRIGSEIVDLLSIEAEANVFPADQQVTGRKLQALAGARLGSRSRVFGLFGKLRAGGMRFGSDFFPPETVCVAIFPPPKSCLASRRAFALDYGSVVEIYPRERWIIRIDAGTTYIWYGRQEGDGRRRAGNFQLTLGLGRRF